MPNLVFQFEVLKRVIAERAAAGDRVASNLSAGNFDNALMPFAVLGAMGPDALRYMPVSNALATFLSGLVPSATSGAALTQATASQAQTSLAALTAPGATPAQQALAFELYFNPLGAAYSVLFNALVIPVWPILNQITAVFDQLDAIVQNQDTIGLAKMLGTVGGLQTLQASLGGLPATLAALQVVIGIIITEGPWMEMNQTFPDPADPTVDRRYEFLRWHRTGAFARELLARATTANQTAYAFGWLCHISSSVTAEPFINNIVGGPYRTHWWRNRLAANFVDSWTFGFFEQPSPPSMSGDNPTPAYCDPQTGRGWPSICGGNLQNLFNVANLTGPSTPDGVPAAVTAMASGNLAPLLTNFPSEISALLTDTIEATYTTPLGSPLFPKDTLPNVGLDANGNKIPAFQADTFARAYIGAFAVYWFMTSGSGPVGNNPAGVPTGMPEPSWISSQTVPSPQQAGLNVGAVVCAILSAIVALFEILVGNYGLGIAALIAALEAPIIDWSQVANELFWLRKTLADQENMLRDALVWTALAYPPPVLLGMVDADGNTLPVTDLTQGQALPTTNVPPTQGIPLCKTNALSPSSATAGRVLMLYPRRLDTTSAVAPLADLNFDTYPILIQAEQDITDILIPANQYPNALIQSTAPVLNGGIMGAAPWPTGDQLFGDAVANAVEVITRKAVGLLDYNLDADRGYGWQTWDPKLGSNPFNPPVQAIPEP